mmetsp:Transcript_39801/g.45330  ORF Transcript_39801/g.45330 Transcript_39801/m.45330 type:complete len:149 (-) Transcript_39801:4-450(-)
MNGGFGGGPAFDFGDNYGFCPSNNDQQDQHSQQQQNRYIQNAAHFDSYDTSIGSTFLGLQYNNPYASTASHRNFLPSVTGVPTDTLLQLQQQQQQQLRKKYLKNYKINVENVQNEDDRNECSIFLNSFVICCLSMPIREKPYFLKKSH